MCDYRRRKTLLSFSFVFTFSSKHHISWKSLGREINFVCQVYSFSKEYFLVSFGYAHTVAAEFMSIDNSFHWVSSSQFYKITLFLLVTRRMLESLLLKLELLFNLHWGVSSHVQGHRTGWKSDDNSKGP